MSPTEYGAAHRRLLQTDAGDLYQQVVLEGSISADDPRVVEGGPDHEAFTFLVDLGLLALDPPTESYLPVDPEVVNAADAARRRGRRLIRNGSGPKVETQPPAELKQAIGDGA